MALLRLCYVHTKAIVRRWFRFSLVKLSAVTHLASLNRSILPRERLLRTTQGVLTGTMERKIFIWVFVAASVKHELTSDTKAENSSPHFLRGGPLSLEHKWFPVLYQSPFITDSEQNDHLWQPLFPPCNLMFVLPVHGMNGESRRSDLSKTKI